MAGRRACATDMHNKDNSTRFHTILFPSDFVSEDEMYGIPDCVQLFDGLVAQNDCS